MGLGTMTVLHGANVEGSDPIMNGVYAGGFESLVEATRQVKAWLRPRRLAPHPFRINLSCRSPLQRLHHTWRISSSAPIAHKSELPSPFSTTTYSIKVPTAGPLPCHETPWRMHQCKLALRRHFRVRHLCIARSGGGLREPFHEVAPLRALLVLSSAVSYPWCRWRPGGRIGCWCAVSART